MGDKLNDRTSVYSEADQERFLAEEHYSRRTDFARDRARVLHSSSLRRLAAKTQVMSPTLGSDFARNRLTHSLEVAQVGREIGTALGVDPDLVDTACLVHDLGHPPFGHNGETALNDWAADIGGFEGNAQSLRLLTRLEAKVMGLDGRSYGLNLTRASLDASLKYPWRLDQAVTEPGSNRQKFGVYDDDAEIFDWVREGLGHHRPAIEAQIMDLADDIAYSVHDFEDAIFGGFISVPELQNPNYAEDHYDQFRRVTGEDFTLPRLEAAIARIRSNDFWMKSWDEGRADQARLKNLTSQFIGRFLQVSITATQAHFAANTLIRHQAEVIVPQEIRDEIALLKGIVALNVMHNKERQPAYRQQRELLTELADRLWQLQGQELEPMFRSDWQAADSDRAARRVVVDQVASLSDQSATAMHRRLLSYLY